jgi:hypothetical protein
MWDEIIKMNLKEVICVAVKGNELTVQSVMNTCRHKNELACFLRVKLITSQFVSPSVSQSIYLVSYLDD